MADNKKTSALPICEEELTISRHGGSLPIFSASPDDKMLRPGLILVHEIFGVNEHIKDLARRFAKEGYVVFAPDLFAYSPNLPVDRNDLGAMRHCWSSISDEQILDDLNAVFSFARKAAKVDASAIGAIGYCMGGAIAFMHACRNPLLSFVVDYYGRIYYNDITETKARHPISYTGGLNCPFLGLFAGLDDLITEEHVQHLRQKMQDLGKSAQIKVFSGAKHAFFNDQREFYHHEAANEAWQLTIAFMDAHSRSI